MALRSVCAGLAAVLAVTSCQGRDFPLTRDVLGVIQRVRPFELRLAARQDWRGCVPADTTRLLPQALCRDPGPDVARELTRLSARVAAAVHHPDADALWAAALLDLWSGRDDPRRLDRAIDRLIEVRMRDSTVAAASSHLAVAYLARASLHGDARDLFAAVDAIERAAAVDSVDAAISFNRAVLFDYVRADRQALALWSSRIERAPGWVDESGSRRVAAQARLEHPDRAERWSEDAVARDPQAARESVLDSLLDRWSAAYGLGDDPGAQGALTLIDEVGATLAALHGDASIASVARDLHSVTSTTTAGVVRRMVEASRAYARVEWSAARTLSSASVTAFESTGQHALADWARTTLGGAALAQNDFATARQAFEQAAQGARRRGDLSLLGRATWGLGILHGRSSSMDAAERDIDAARVIFAGLGEARNVATLDGTLVEIYGFFGRSAESAGAAYRAFSSGARIRYEDHLALAQRLSDEGFPYASVVQLQEASLMSARSSREKDVPEAGARLALGLAAIGERGRALTVLASARSRASRVGDPDMRARLDAELARSRAHVEVGRDPALALAYLDSSAAFFRTIPVEHAGLLLMRSRLSLSIGDSTGATADLDAALDRIRTFAASPSPVVRRQTDALLRDAERGLVALALSRSDTAAAFAHTVAVSAVPFSAPPTGAAEVRFVVLPDRMIVWLFTASSRAAVQVQTPPPVVAAQVTRFVNLVRSGDDPASAKTLGRLLYAELLGGHAAGLSGLRRIDIVPDDVIHDVPFAVLVDDSGRYVAERLATRILTAGTQVRAPAAKPKGRVHLLIGDPAWDRAMFPDLEPLRWAGREVASIDSLYADAVLLEGAAASKAGVITALRHAAVVHFAGHARVITNQPAASHLVLASRGNAFSESVLNASEIGGLSLAHVRLVILSACGPSGPMRGAGNALAQAFLDAGVEAVLASRWELDDESTATLMRAIHGYLAGGSMPDEALRRAQSDVLARSRSLGLVASSGLFLYTRKP